MSVQSHINSILGYNACYTKASKNLPEIEKRRWESKK
jgi:hypothetical protein